MRNGRTFSKGDHPRRQQALLGRAGHHRRRRSAGLCRLARTNRWSQPTTIGSQEWHPATKHATLSESSDSGFPEPAEPNAPSGASARQIRASTPHIPIHVTYHLSYKPMYKNLTPLWRHMYKGGTGPSMPAAAPPPQAPRRGCLPPLGRSLIDRSRGRE